MEVTLQLGDELRRFNLVDAIGMTSDRVNLFSELAGAAMVDSTVERFNAQQSPEGVPWLPSLRALEQGGETLRDTGRLMTSLTYNVMPNGVEWGTNVIYAPIHHYGGTIRAKDGGLLKFMTALGFRQVESVEMPARPYMGVNRNDEIELQRILERVLSND